LLLSLQSRNVSRNVDLHGTVTLTGHGAPKLGHSEHNNTGDI
jgi:hypothetical protein